MTPELPSILRGALLAFSALVLSFIAKAMANEPHPTKSALQKTAPQPAMVEAYRSSVLTAATQSRAPR